MIPWLGLADPFPAVETALESPNGLLCAGGDLSPERLLEAYSHGIFPWFSEDDPILWWSPDPRMVLFPAELKVSRSLRKTLAHETYEVRVDTAFTRVMAECAAPRDGQAGTWILPEMIAAYTRLHEQGHAHSVESWREGELVGGLYGLQLGRAFFGESMFSRATDASKVALAALVGRLAASGCRVIDCQQATGHLASLGAREIPRAAFVRLLRESIQYPPSGSRWT
ncbi:leucyl/phenylalanyl-tRNA--protein transferase [Betaproteobacteria bacterium GR16-43]|nr:leucyl/phenylalanyl-tRNA--protein transferase [Betaproteobacteria bacterium GR16-43]